MAQFLSIRLRGGKEAVERIKERRARARDLRPAWRAVQAIGIRDVKKHFRATEGPAGRWPGKKPVAVKFSGGRPVAFDKGYWVRGKFRPKRKTGVGVTGQLSRTTGWKANPRSLRFFNPQVYAPRFHDGFKGTQSISGHSRKITRAFGRKLKRSRTVRVRSHSIRINQPPRPFLYMSRGARKRISNGVARYIVTGKTTTATA